jgi:hypothetical protein
VRSTIGGAKYCWNNEFKEDEMARECSMNKEEERVCVISRKVGRKETTKKTKT